MFSFSQPLVSLNMANDAASASLSASDIVYVNGTFNGWCGTCNALTQSTGDIWTLVLPLAPGEYEYKFTVNGWDQEEDVPLNGSCDYLAGDESANRGFNLTDAPIDLGTMCYSSCGDCGN